MIESYDKKIHDLKSSISTLTADRDKLKHDLAVQLETYASSGSRIEELTKDLSHTKKKLKEKENSLKLFMENVEETTTYKTLRGINEDLILEIQSLKADRDRANSRSANMKEEIERMIAYAMNGGLHIPTNVSLLEL
jgi:predicted  nucleic acid-binding Zn-ribbon protein